jgi:ABC-type multidrug transport system fused ATPase/permease subunit
MTLQSIVKRFFKSILLAVSLVIIEHLAWIVEPTVFGKVIDAVIDKNASIENVNLLLPLFLWIGLFLINSGVGSFRRSFDQKIYLRMFTQIATEVAEKGKKQDLSVSMIAGRAELTKEYISFFQYRIPEIIEQSIAIFGAIVALFFFDYRIGFTCMFIILPILLVTRLYTLKVQKLQKDLHDVQEGAYLVYSTLDINQINGYYKKYSSFSQKIANWSSFNFGILRLSLLAIFLIVLYISIDLDDFTTGNIYSIVTYLWTFVTSSEYLPDLFESLTSIKDLSTRLQSIQDI